MYMFWIHDFTFPGYSRRYSNYCRNGSYRGHGGSGSYSGNNLKWAI